MRVNVPINGSLKIVDSIGRKIGFSIQNVSAVDIYYSDDQRQLDGVGAANLPSVGHVLAAAAPVLPPVVYPKYANGRLFVRAQNLGAQLELIIYEVDLPCK